MHRPTASAKTGMGRPRGRVLATTDVDDPRPMLRGQEDCPRQIELRARRGEESVGLAALDAPGDVAENGHHDPPATRSDPLDRALRFVPPKIRLATRVPCRVAGPPWRGPPAQRLRPSSGSPRSGRVRSIDRPVEHRDRDPRIARRLGPEIASP